MTYVISRSSDQSIISDLQQRVATLERLLQFYVNATIETTGSGSAALGSNCPASTPATPYTWLENVAADGSIIFVPAWA